jgi:hypothetical protein
MTRLRKMMLEELQRRNYAETTTRHYIRTVEDFARRFNRPPDRLGPRHIREYQAELFRKRKLSPNSVIRHLAALRFFFVKTVSTEYSVQPMGDVIPLTRPRSSSNSWAWSSPVNEIRGHTRVQGSTVRRQISNVRAEATRSTLDSGSLGGPSFVAVV